MPATSATGAGMTLKLLPVACGNPHRNDGCLLTLAFVSKARTIARRRFPPWQVLELQGGYAVEDAEGYRLCIFFGSADPSMAKQADVLTLDEARQMAFDFARLPELLKVE